MTSGSRKTERVEKRLQEKQRKLREKIGRIQRGFSGKYI
jgi:hypothetical protein